MRKHEVQVTDLAVKFAGNYIEDHFKSGTEVERHQVMNTLAHGYYMGLRHAEKLALPRSFEKLRRLLRIKRWPEFEALVAISNNAAAHYMRSKRYERLAPSENAFIRASLSQGFRVGFLAREHEGKASGEFSQA